MTPFWHTVSFSQELLTRNAIESSVIKTYCSRPSYDNGNVDLVVTKNLEELFESVFAEDFFIKTRDMRKYRYYEKNKLMLTPKNPRLRLLHLHSNAGWHNISFIDGEHIIQNSAHRKIGDLSVISAADSLDKEIHLLHMIFENFKKKELEEQVLSGPDYRSFCSFYNINLEAVLPIMNASVGKFRFKDMLPIWLGYYKVRKQQTPIGSWNYFLHAGLYAKSLTRG